MSGFIDSLRSSFENLNERERRLVVLLGGLVLLAALLLPIWWAATSLSTLSANNRTLSETLSEVRLAEAELQARRAERQARDELYGRPTPALGSFLEEQAKAAGYDRPLPKLNDQPDKSVPGFRRRHSKVTLTSIDLRTIIKLLTNIKNSPHPVAIESVRIDHFRGRDKYNIQLGVFAFDKVDDEEDAGGKNDRRRGRDS